MGFGRSKVAVACWLVLAMVGQLAALVALRRVFVGTELGQQVETAALAGNVYGRERVFDLVVDVLDLVSVMSLLVATGVIGFIALARRRIGLALVAIMLIVGANVTTQLLKTELVRPDLAVDGAARAGNSLPSGHTTVAASVAVALVLVLPPRLRGIGALVGAVYAGLTGVATLSAGWHRPSDAVGAYLVVGVWAAFAGLLLVLLRRRTNPNATPSRGAHPLVVTVLAGAGVLLLMASALALQEVSQVFPVLWRDFGDDRFRIAYAGGITGIAGTACAAMAIFVATVHLVAPHRTLPRQHRADPAAEPARVTAPA